MLKIILTAAIVFSVGILSLLKTTTTATNVTTKVTTVKFSNVLANNRTILATAD